MAPLDNQGPVFEAAISRIKTATECLPNRPLTAEEAAYTQYGSPLWLEEKRGMLCDVRFVRTWGYCQKGDLHWALQMDFSESTTPNACSAWSMALSSVEYNKTWRLWPSQPSVEESRAVPWE